LAYKSSFIPEMVNKGIPKILGKWPTFNILSWLVIFIFSLWI